MGSSRTHAVKFSLERATAASLSSWVHWTCQVSGLSSPSCGPYVPSPTSRDAPWAVEMMLQLSQQGLNKMTQRSPFLSKPQVSSLITIHDKKKILWLRLWTGLLYQQEAGNLGCQYAHLAKQKFTWKPLGSPAMAFHQPTASGTNFHWKWAKK